ncbi:hypothetical protein CHUAL_003101 [Chamberlinius hualienensis]
MYNSYGKLGMVIETNMAENNNIKCSKSYEKYCQRKIYDKFHSAIEQYYEATEKPLRSDDLERLLLKLKPCNVQFSSEEEDIAGWKASLSQWKRQLAFVLILLISAFAMKQNGVEDLIKRVIYSPRCLLQNNFFLMEISRPLSNCSLCENVRNVVVLDESNTTRENFARFAYTAHPVLVKRATLNWLATKTFSFDFFKQIYTNVDGAFNSVEEECQFFPFRTEFTSLREVFEMSNDRAKGLGSEKTWYVGWSNCHPEIAKILRQHYTRPTFLPEDSESSAIDWIFIGWPGMGASIHVNTTYF